MEIQSDCVMVEDVACSIPYIGAGGIEWVPGGIPPMEAAVMGLSLWTYGGDCNPGFRPLEIGGKVRVTSGRYSGIVGIYLGNGEVQVNILGRKIAVKGDCIMR